MRNAGNMYFTMVGPRTALPWRLRQLSDAHAAGKDALGALGTPSLEFSFHVLVV